MNQRIFGQWGRQLSPTTRGSLFYLGVSGASATFFPFINVFYADRGLSGREIGLLTAIGPVVALIAAPLLVALADRHGWQVQMMVVGLAGVALTTLILPLAQPFAVLLAVVGSNGLIGSTVGSISDGTIAQMAVRHQINYGKMRLWGSVAWVVMSLLGGFLWPLFGLWLMFPLASLLFVVTMFAARLLGDDGSSAKVERQPLRLITGAGRFWAVLICAVFMSLGAVMARTFSAIYIDRLSGQTLVGLYAAVAAAIEIPAMLWAAHVVRRVGGPFTLALSCLLMGGAFLGLAIIPRPELLLLAALVEGTGFGLFVTATVRLVADWAPRGKVATYQGLLNAGSSGLAPLAAGLLGGAIFDAAGPQTVFIASMAAAVAAVVVLLLAQVLGLFSGHTEQAEAAPSID
ncbi:MAG TPA: MFS transporter [Chloroflexia bacterium]|nr:MFS transporter [Chloroflexia bacterium]